MPRLSRPPGGRAVALLVVGFWLIGLLAACSGKQSAGQPTGTASGQATANSPAGATSTSTAPGPGTGTPSVTPDPTDQASPTAPTVEPLAIDGAAVEQVVVPAPGIDIVYAITKAGLYRRAPGQGWTLVSPEIAADVHILADPTRPDILYRGDHPACAVGGAPVPFEKSLDGGKTWQTLPNGENIRPVAIDPANAGRLYGESCTELAISSDGGQTWSTTQPVPNFDIASLALVGTDLYGVYSSEGGTSRLVVTDVSNPAQPVTGDTLFQFWGGGVVSASLDRIIVAESHGVHVSTDEGKTWSFSRAGLEEVTTSVDALTAPIPQPEVARGFGLFAIATDTRRPDRIYLGTIHGVYLSIDGGKTWQPVSGVPADRVRAVAFSMPQSQIFITTDAGALVLSNP